MPAEHMRPSGLSQGYYCPRCGCVCNMMATGHGFGLCEPNMPLVMELRDLNRVDIEAVLERGPKPKALTEAEALTEAKALRQYIKSRAAIRGVTVEEYMKELEKK